MANETRGSDYGGDDDFLDEDYDAQLEELLARGHEQAAALNDLRQAWGGLRGGTQRQLSEKQRKDKQAQLEKVPRCDECGGRHLVKPCPNTYAKRVSWDAQEAARNNKQCSYHEPRYPLVACGGRGRHLNPPLSSLPVEPVP